jgi:formyl-CoA transferase
VRVGIPVADLTAGIFAAQGILIALLEREVSGLGQWVQSSLLGAQIAMLDFQAARWTVGGEVPEQAGNDHPTSIPTGVFATADGHINIAAAGNDIYRRLCRALGREELAGHPDYATDSARSANRKALNAEIEAVTRGRTSAAWIDSLNAAGVPCGPIYSMDQVFADPQVKHLGMAHPAVHPTRGAVGVVAQPIVMSRSHWELRNTTPEQGEHTDAILREIGFDDAEIRGLRERKVV